MMGTDCIRICKYILQLAVNVLNCSFCKEWNLPHVTFRDTPLLMLQKLEKLLENDVQDDTFLFIMYNYISTYFKYNKSTMNL